MLIQKTSNLEETVRMLVVSAIGVMGIPTSKDVVRCDNKMKGVDVIDLSNLRTKMFFGYSSKSDVCIISRSTVKIPLCYLVFSYLTNALLLYTPSTVSARGIRCHSAFRATLD